MHAISSYRGNRPTNPQTLTARPPTRPPQTGPITIHSAAKLSAQCNDWTLQQLNVEKELLGEVRFLKLRYYGHTT